MRILWMIPLFMLAVPDRPDPTPREERPPHEQIVSDWLYIGDTGTGAPKGVPVYVLRILATETIWMENNRPMAGNGFTATVTFDWTKKPVAIDFIQRGGGGRIPGILQLDGDRLILAWSNDSNTRPTDFASARQVHHFTRVKK